MDGGGRLLESLSAAGGVLLADEPARGFNPFALFQRSVAGKVTTERASVRMRKRRHLRGRWLSRSWLGAALAVTVVGGAGFYGVLLGGEYASFVAAQGTPADMAAKLFGFEIETITISGLDELNQTEVLDAAGVSPRNSLLFLNAASVRDQLRAVPLIKDVTVRKLFPNSLTLDVTERGAAALWQKDGQLSVVSGDGVAIDDVRDSRFNSLPFVVGRGANDHLKDYLDLLDSAGDLRDRITAGIYVGERRWTLQMDSGVEVMLPEIDPKTALARLAALDHTAKVIDKDVIWLDLRIPGRVTARLSEDAAAARAAMIAKKPKKAMKE